MTPRVVLLPGMDGTGELFSRFVAARPAGWETQVVSFPTDRPLGYAALAEIVRDELPQDGRFVLLGESFSGPLALRLAAEAPAGLQGVVLCASFVTAPPGTRLAAWLARIGSRVRPPRWALRRRLTGGDRQLADHVAQALSSVSPQVIAARLAAIAAVDARDDLRHCPVPLLVLSATRDRVVGPASANEVARLRPDATVLEIEAPHLLLQTAPTAAWSAIVNHAARSRLQTDASPSENHS